VIRILATVMVLLAWLWVGGCQGTGEKTAGGEDTTGDVEVIEEDLADADAEDETPEKTYFSNHDPDAIYTAEDLPRRSSYLKLDFSGLTPEQLDHAIHRLKTENCNCGCVDDTIDECLVIDPDCVTAVELAKMILREEKAG